MKGSWKTYFKIAPDMQGALAMGRYDRKDHYYRKAKAQGLPSRAVFKLEEILKKFRLLKKGQWAIDFGAAPGGWTHQLLETLGPGGRVLALDRIPLKKVQAPNLRFHLGDFADPMAQAWIQDQLAGKKVHLICSDLSPDLSGIPFKDAYLSFEMGQNVWKISQKHLRPGGHFIIKMFPGSELEGFLKGLRQEFEKVKVFEPQATRKTSKEIYLIAQKYLADEV